MCGLGTERLGCLWCLLFYSVVSSKGTVLAIFSTCMQPSKPTNSTLRVRFFGKIRIRIFDPRSLGLRCIKGTDESLPRVDSSVYHDPSDLG